MDLESLFFDVALPFVLVMIAVACVGLFGVLAVEIAQEYRSYDERVACEAERMVPRRKMLTATVTCVPVPMRQDTLTIERAPGGVRE